MILQSILLSTLLLQTRPTTGPSQQADPDFDATVAKPAYVDRHPSVVIDEAHNMVERARSMYSVYSRTTAVR